MNFTQFTFRIFWPKISFFLDKISFKRPGADFSERHSFRCKWFRTYLGPFCNKKQQVLGHMKYSPIDHQSIPLEIHQKMPFFWDKISFKRPGADFYERHSFRCKWLRTYLGPFCNRKQQVIGHMKYSPSDHQSIPLEIHKKMSKNTKILHIFEPRWPVEHIQQAIYAK